MPLTTAQNSTVKTNITASGDMNTLPNTSDGAFAIADLYNLPASPDFYVWRTNIPTQEVYDAIVWANLTPNDVPDGTQLWLNRAMACQGKQFNLQTILTGRDSIDASKSSLRTGFQDALTGLPSGISGATRAAGWTTLQLVMSRKATRLEKLLATGTGSQASPATMGFEGSVSYQEIQTARA